MPVHTLTANTPTKCFRLGERADCFIVKMDNNRFAVTDADFKGVTPHYEVFTENELHDTFNEV